MTQEYTPVAWQDETTSQQGTLINAERLNQMQQAHHFADGLEEVDAIPTADPGVGYHKIVYCTADSTIYRWDGTEWTADIDDETKALLQQEIARATAAEGVLAQDITDEETARETADTAMQADISALQSGKLDKQTTGSTTNITKVYAVTRSTQKMLTVGYLSDAIPQYNVEQTLFSKMPTLWDPIDDTVINYGWATAQIGAEATARADADTALGGRIDTEQARAEAAEQANAQAIANTYTKAEIDTALALKADVATTYSKTETDTLLGAKANDNAVVKLTGPQTIYNIKTFNDGLVAYPQGWHNMYDGGGVAQGAYTKIATINNPSDIGYNAIIEFMAGGNNGLEYGRLAISGANSQGLDSGLYTWIDRSVGIQWNKVLFDSKGVTIAKKSDGTVDILLFKRDLYGGVIYRTVVENTYGSIISQANTRIEYVTPTPVSISDYATTYTPALGSIEGIDYATLQDAQAVQNALDGYLPMFRTTGNQTALGQKTIESLIVGLDFNNKCTVTAFDADTSKYCRMYTYNDSTGAQYKSFMVMITPKRLNINRTGLLYFGDNRNSSPVIGWLLKGSDIANTDFVITKEADGTINLWCKTYTGAADGYHGIRVLEHTTSNLSAGYLEAVVNEEGYTISTTGYTDKNGVVHTFTNYITPR